MIAKCFQNVEYVWVDDKQSIRSKTRTLKAPVEHLEDVPEWTCDGSKCELGSGQLSEVILRPAAFFRNPFGTAGDAVVLCEVYVHFNGDLVPTASNFRRWAKHLASLSRDRRPKFELNQEYQLLGAGGLSAGYCAVGLHRNFGREFAQGHYLACQAAGVRVSGMWSDSVVGRWVFTVGPCDGVVAGDHLWMARYLLFRQSEKTGLPVALDAPRMLCSVGFSTKEMRAGNQQAFQDTLDRLLETHDLHQAVYAREPAPFTYLVGEKSCSVRIPVSDERFVEDRRPGSNHDPYVVTALLMNSVVAKTDVSPIADAYLRQRTNQ